MVRPKTFNTLASKPSTPYADARAGRKRRFAPMEGNEIIPHAGTYEEPQSNPVNAIEVTVIGGGLPGIAASIHLSRAGRGFCASSLT
jgi:hypothetical protein